MAGNLVNALYAPIVPTFAKAFPNNTDAVVYFSYSPLNDSTAVQKIHVTVVNQLNNENALNTITGVEIYDATNPKGNATSIGYDEKFGMYYVVIQRSKLKGNTWNINQYYKVQLRLDKTQGGSYANDKTKAQYLQNNLLNFSEWSTVCLLRPITAPTIKLTGLITKGSGGLTPAFNKGIVPINGRVNFKTTSETETLQYYKIEILPRNEKTVVYSTGNIYTGDLVDPNNINYKLNLQGLDTDNTRNFTLRLTITTKNQYSVSTEYDFDIADFIEMTDFHPAGVNDDVNDKSIRVKIDNDEGIVSFRFINDVAIYGNLYIKRSSSISNFKDWESIHEEHVSDTVDMTITDNTVGSHIWYRYSIQLENSTGGLSQVYYTDLVFPEFYDAFLTRQNTQLPLRYDFKVSSVQPVVNRSKVDTLGGKYPKFTENAVLNYKQFSVNGVMSAEGDYGQKFLSKSKYFGSDDYANYRVYLSKNNVESVFRNDVVPWPDNNNTSTLLTTTRNDYFWEREFREEAVKWLNDGEPKLFRSMTEGLIPVMVTDIHLTPKQELGRRLYDFSATMYEIADGHSLAALENLGIINIPKVAESTGTGNGSNQPSQDFRTVTTVGQVYEFYPNDNRNIITTGQIYHNIVDKYNYGGIYSQKEVIPGSISLKNVQIYFHNEPHMFVVSSNNSLQLVTRPTQAQLNSKQIQMGYTFNIVTKDSKTITIFVNERGYYQIPDHLEITSLSFNQYSSNNNPGDRVTVNYLVTYRERNAESSIVSGQSIDRTLIGQYQGVYKPGQYLGETIRAKYNYVTPLYTQRMQYWRGISLDVTPYAVAYIQYRNNTGYTEYVVGPTGILHLLQDFPIIDMCFFGVRLVKQPLNRQKFLAEHEYVVTEEEYDSIEDVKHPKANAVYTINGKSMIYYHDLWVDFDERNDGTGVAAINVEGAINFLGDVVQISY